MSPGSEEVSIALILPSGGLGPFPLTYHADRGEWGMKINDAVFFTASALFSAINSVYQFNKEIKAIAAAMSPVVPGTGAQYVEVHLDA